MIRMMGKMMINYLIDGTLLACPSEDAPASEIKRYFDSLDRIVLLEKEHHNISVWFSEKTGQCLRTNNCYPTQDRLAKLYGKAEGRPIDKYCSYIGRWFHVDKGDCRPSFQEQFDIKDYKNHKDNGEYEGWKNINIPRELKTVMTTDTMRKDTKFNLLILGELCYKFKINNFCLIVPGNFKNKTTEAIIKGINYKDSECDNKLMGNFMELLSRAKKEFEKTIVFDSNVDKSLRAYYDGLSKDNRDSIIREKIPECLYYYLEALSLTSEYLNNHEADINKIRHSFYMNNMKEKNEIIITKLYGCLSSNESDSTLNNIGLMLLHTINDYKFTFHLKPVTKGKLTIRIYFRWDEQQKKIVVGHIGKHLCTSRDYENRDECKCHYARVCEKAGN